MSNIKNIVFDLGGVLVNWSPKICVEVLIGKNELGTEVHKAIFGSGVWQNLDNGSMSEFEAISELTNKFPHLKKEINIVFSSYKPFLSPLEENVKTLKLLKEKGYKIYLLSNIFKEVWDFIYSRDEYFKFFNGLILSFEEKEIKPGKQIFENLLSKYDLKPEECYYIDDMKENTETGAKLNFNVLHLESNTRILPHFQKAGILE